MHARPSLIAAVLAAALALPAAAAPIATSVDTDALPRQKATALGLYVTSRDAAAALAVDPEIVLLDVRTRAEFQFVGHATPADANIPLLLLDTSTFQQSRYGMAFNPDFATRFDALMTRQGLGRDAPVFVICRSGGRSAAAVDLLAKAGYTNVWNIVDGFEGRTDITTGHRTVEGWRNQGLPWTYQVTPTQAYR